MSFRLLIKDQLVVFFDNLKNLIAAKHDVVPESFPEHAWRIKCSYVVCTGWKRI